MKFITPPLTRLMRPVAAAALLVLTGSRALAHPYASAVTGTNGAGFVSFYMNEGGATVTITFNDLTTTNLGVLPKGPTNFFLGSHTSFKISCFKAGNGIPTLISDDTYTNSQWANPRSVDVNKNPKNGALFGRIYVGSAGPGGIAFGDPVFKAQGLYAYNPDQTDAIGQGTNALFGDLFAPGGQGGNSPWHLRVTPDNSVVVGDQSVQNASVWLFPPNLSSNTQLLAGVGDSLTTILGVHGRQWSAPLVLGSLATHDMVLWTGDNSLGAPTSTNTIKGPGTSPNSFNCVMRYDIGSGEYYVTNAALNFGLSSATTDPNTHIIGATPVPSSVSTVAADPSKLASASVNANFRLVSAGVGPYTVTNVAIASNKVANTAIIPSSVTAVSVSSNVHLTAASVGTTFEVQSATALPNSVSAATLVQNSVSTARLVTNALSAVAIASGGTGYTNGTVLTIAGGLGTRATVTVTATNASNGAITAVSITSAGNYSTLPSTPNSPFGGSGTGASLNLTFGSGSGYAVGNVLTVAGGVGTAATVTVTNVSSLGVINGITNSAAGNYTALPATPNSPTGGGGSGAGLTLTFGTGSGYAVGNVLSIAGGTGTPATITVTNVSTLGVINSFTNSAAGNYSVLPTTPNSPTGGSGTAVRVNLTFGTGRSYTNGTVLNVAGGTGTPATATVTSVSSLGVITGFAITSVGSYSVAPAATNSPTSTVGTGASLALNIVGAGGTGYVVNDVLTLSPSVTAATVNSNKIAIVSIASGGTGYTNGSVLTLQGGVGTFATATVTGTNASGTITNVSISNYGNYTTVPASPNSPTGGSGTGASLNVIFGTGTNYVLGNVLTAGGGTPISAGAGATFVVTGVGTNGILTAISLASSGFYSAAPATPNTTTGGAGTGASLNLTVAGTGTAVATVRVTGVNGNGGVTSVTVVSNGNYSIGPVSPNFVIGGFPGAKGASLNLTYVGSGGTGYTPGNVLTISGGSGTPATATVGAVGGSGDITSVSVTTAGNYTAAPPTVNNTPTGGSGANAILTLALGTGSGYSLNDLLSVNGGTGTAATLTVTNVTSLGVITTNGLSITSAGNYTVSPITSNNPTGGSGTGAKVQLTMGTGSGYTNGTFLFFTGGTPATNAIVSVSSTNLGGAITAIALANAGNYTNPPTSPVSPTVTNGSGSGALIIFGIAGGGGTNYNVGDVVTLGGGTVAAGGTNATVTVVNTNAGGVVTAVAVANAGFYSTAPATPNSPTGGSGTGLRLNLGFITGAGSGYTNGSVLTIAGGTGSAATVTVTGTNAAGGITNLSVTTTGSYTAPPPTPNSPAGGSGTGALLNLTMGTGSGYAVGNNLTIAGGTGSSAIATVTSVAGGIITGVAITNNANAGNYTAPPPSPNPATGGAGTGASLLLTFGTGTNYTTNDVLVLAGGTSTTNATLTVTNVSSRGVINGLAVRSAGNYSVSPPSPNSPTGGTGGNARLNLLLVNGGGTNYSVGDVLTISGGVGTSATVTVATTNSGGVITALTVTTPGNYTTPPPLTNSPTGGTGTGAILNLVLGNSGSTSGGSGYQVGDLLRISGGTSSIAATVSVASVSGTAISTLNVVNRGHYSAAPPVLNTPVTITGSGSGAILNLTVNGPLNWINPPNYAYTVGLDGIAALRPTVDIGKDGKIIAGFGRANGSNPNVQILSPNGSNLLWTSWNEIGAAGPGGNNPPDPWAGINGSGTINGTYGGVKTSPDGLYLASQDLNNGITIANMTNGIPDDGTIFGIVNAPGTVNARGFCWDAADNIWSASSGQGLLRCYSLGFTTTCVTSNDFTGTNGSFTLTRPGVFATVAATTPIASQNYVNNTINPGAIIPGKFTITLSTNDLTGLGPVSVAFTLSGSAVLGTHYSMQSNAFLASGIIITTTNVVFPSGLSPSGNWSVDIPIYPLKTPLSGPTTAVTMRVLGGTVYAAGIPVNASVAILNTGPQLLTLSTATGGNMSRGIPGDYARFTLTRTGDTNGPGNDSLSVSPVSYTVTNWNYFGTATNPLDYTALAQVLYPTPPYGALSAPTNGGNSVFIPAGVNTLTVVVGNPVKHTDLTQTPTNLIIVVNLTNRTGLPDFSTNASSAEGYNYTVDTSEVTLNEFDNTIGKGEVVMYSNPLTNAADSVNWTLVFAGTAMASDPVLPTVIPNYPNNQTVYGSEPDAAHDFEVAFGHNIADESIPPSDYMYANGYSNVLKLTVNKTAGAEAGVNLYPQGKVFQGNYALRFDMYLSIYQYATNSNDTTASIAAREYAAFGLNHYGTNCNWRLDANPRAPGTGSAPTNSDGVWCCIDAGFGAITPADYDLFTPPAIPNQHGAVTNGVAFADQVSANAASQSGVFKHPPFSSISPTTGGEPVDQWVDVSFEITQQTNLSVFVARQKVLGSYPLTNTFYGVSNAIGPFQNQNGAYLSGTPMLGYLDPNASISDPGSSFVFYSNLRVVEMSPYIIVQPSVQVGTNFQTSAIAVQGSSVTFTSSCTYAFQPGITNVWYQGTTPATAVTNGVPVIALQTNSVNATNMSDSLTYTMNEVSDATNYMCVFTDRAGSITSLVTTVEVVFPPASKTNALGANTNLTVTFAGATAPTLFQWYYNSVSNLSTATKLANNVNYSGVTTATLGMTNVVTGHAGYYWCATTNTAGGVVPEAALLTVITPPSTAVVVPANQTLNWGATANFTVTASGSPVSTYQWKKAGTNISNGTKYAGVATASLTISNLTQADTAAYTAGLTNLAGGTVSSAGNLGVAVPQPTVGGVSIAGGNVILSFTSPNGTDNASGFILQSCGVVDGTYTNTPGTFTGGPGSFQVLTPKVGETMFYRLKHAN